MTNTTNEKLFEILYDKIVSISPGFGQLPWLDRKDEFSTTEFRLEFSRLRRKLAPGENLQNGEAPLNFNKNEIHVLTQNGLPSANQRPLHILARIACLLRAAQLLGEEKTPRFVHELFTRGDTPEKCAILCALPLFSCPQDYHDTAVLATRGYIREVFESIALQNPYPAKYFGDPVFNQMLLKAFFLDVPLADVIGLDRRINDELHRMAADFIKERTAAGRALPKDIDLILHKEIL